MAPVYENVSGSCSCKDVTVVVTSVASSSIVLSSFVVVGVAFTFTVFVKYAIFEVVNTDRYVPVFFTITFDVDVVA